MSYQKKNQPIAAILTVANSSSFGGDNLTVIDGTALSLLIDATQATGAVSCQFNGSDDCVFNVNKGVVYGWSYQDIQVSSVDFANTSGSDQTIQVIAG